MVGKHDFQQQTQPTQIALGKTQSTTDLLKLDYQYGDLDWDGSVIAGSNNGNVAKQTITVAAVGTTPGFTAVQNYDYDSLNRIQIASETLTPTSGSPETWTQEFKYDRYGNRNFNEATTTTLPKNCGTSPNFAVCAADVPKVNPSVNPSNNRLNSTGYSFDSAGNTTKDAENRKFTYDAENKQVKVETVDGSNNVTGTVGEYVYDGDGKRVKKRAYANNALTEETIFVYDASGKLIGEYSNQVASSQDAKVAYLTNDHLGSPRINTDINGNVISRHDYHPFGEEAASSSRTTQLGYAGDSVRNQFTGYERDGESGLDYAPARMYASALGRFYGVDPLLASGSPSNPQSYNRYSYAGNYPLRVTDPSGLTWYQRIDDNGTAHYKWYGDNDTVEDGYHIYMGKLDYMSGDDHVFLNPLGPNSQGTDPYEINGWIINNTPAMQEGRQAGTDTMEGSKDATLELFLTIEGLRGIIGLGAVIDEADAVADAAIYTGSARAKAVDAAEAILANGENPRAVSAAVDITTGETSIGVSGGADPPVIHGLLRERIDVLNSQGGSLRPWCITNCAEFRSVNDALLKGSELNNLEVHTVKTQNGLPAFQRCANCQVTTAGARVTSDP